MIMCDCQAAMGMVDEAWRSGRVGPRGPMEGRVGGKLVYFKKEGAALEGRQTNLAAGRQREDLFGSFRIKLQFSCFLLKTIKSCVV
mgnify:CR=1 FL=1